MLVLIIPGLVGGGGVVVVVVFSVLVALIAIALGRFTRKPPARITRSFTIPDHICSKAADPRLGLEEIPELKPKTGLTEDPSERRAGQ